MQGNISLSECKQHIDEAISALCLDKKEPQGLYRAVDYILSLGGKRIRPVITLIGCSLFSGRDVDAAVMPAVGMEIFHSFTLLHDDIMDRSNLRRGNPTVHKLWGENTAILSGDVMSVLAFECMSKCPVAVLSEVMSVFNRIAMGVMEGQQYDMDFETAGEVSTEDYIRMIKLKTSVLIGGALQIGALCGGADSGEAFRLYGVGESFGIGFQIQDDILDTFGNEALLGKPIGGDIRENKKTWLWTRAMQDGSDEQKKRLIDAGNIPELDFEVKFRKTIEIYNELDICGKAQAEVESYFKEAHNRLDEVAVKEEQKTELRRFLNESIKRDK